jgi:demethylmenaquinone methyltransferase/2-methoxy-6-polyprenyl-1,4-benzoquinol methylase
MIETVESITDGAPHVPPHAPIRGYFAKPEEKRGVLRGMFDRAAGDYDRIEWLMALGSGSRYRADALRRAGLAEGMSVVDVATGTGLVAREAAAIVGDRGRVVGVDPSAGMLAQAVRAQIPGARFAIGAAEQLPLADRSADFLSMGYALRHVGDLGVAFREFARVLRSGGRLCVLELTRPDGLIRRGFVRAYMRWVVPAVALVSASTGSRADARRLMSYYWHTIDQCVPPDRIMSAMRDAGFQNVARHVELGFCSEYTATRGEDD